MAKTIFGASDFPVDDMAEKPHPDKMPSEFPVDGVLYVPVCYISSNS